MFVSKKKEYIEKKVHEIVEEEDSKEKVSESSGIHYVRDDLDENDENDVGVKKRMAFLDMLMTTSMQEGSPLSEQEVQDEINTIMFEVNFLPLNLKKYFSLT